MQPSEKNNNDITFVKKRRKRNNLPAEIRKVEKNIFNKIVSEKIRYVREKKNITIWEIARKSKIARGTYYNIESGESVVSTYNLYRICRYGLMIDINDFLSLVQLELDIKTNKPSEDIALH